MRKIIVLIFSVMFLVGGFGSSKIFENKIQNEKTDDTDIVEVLEDEKEKEDFTTEVVVEEQKETQKNVDEVKTEKVEEKAKTTNNQKTNTSNAKTKKQENVSSNTKQTETKANQDTQPIEQPKTETKKQETTKDTTQNNIVSTTFYDSITHGRKEFKSEAEAIARGDKIVDKELNYVLDYNETHPDNPIQPSINYYRIYPSAIDENGQYWYYLHFFTTNGEGQDDILKSKF